MFIESLTDISWGAIIGVVVGSFIFTKCLFNYRKIYFFLKHLPHDFVLFKCLVKLRLHLRKNEKGDLSTGKIFEEVAKRNPNKIAIYFEEQKWSFRDVSRQSNQLGNYFYEEGYRKGDVVALFMNNGPEYVFTLLGLSKIGVVVALINPTLRLQQLKHCLEVVSCKGVIFKPEMFTALEDAKKTVGLPSLKFYSYDESISAGMFPFVEDVIDLQRQFKYCSDKTPLALSSVGFHDEMCHIYTSGTTGLPKAAIVKQTRFQLNSTFMNKGLRIREDDITLVALPLCHSQGLLFGVGQLINFGTPVAIIRKFSASNFWKQCVKYNATAVPYIGEFCKYLYNQPPSEFDDNHKVRIMLGAGLRVEIWEKFQARFKVPEIIEYYGATEGNCTILNFTGKVGAIGYIPFYASVIFPVFLVQVNKDSGEPIRDSKTGFLVKCKPGEPGEIIGAILPNPARSFEGYADRGATSSKILMNVFKMGDAYFRSGDIIVRDEEGFYYFKDRCGDTFRWKGENVSTFEVEYIIAKICGLKDVTVYGVDVCGFGGQAGMAAIVDEDNSIDIEKLNNNILDSLAPYARPIFLRILQKIDITVTFKLKKGDLRKEGYNRQLVKDPLYILINNKYEILTDEILKQIGSGSLRL